MQSICTEFKQAADRRVGLRTRRVSEGAEASWWLIHCYREGLQPQAANRIWSQAVAQRTPVYKRECVLTAFCVVGFLGTRELIPEGPVE